MTYNVCSMQLFLVNRAAKVPPIGAAQSHPAREIHRYDKDFSVHNFNINLISYCNTSGIDILSIVRK